MNDESANPPVERAAYSIEEWAERYGLSRSTVYNLIASGKLKTSKIGRRRIITVQQDQEFLNRLNTQAS